MRLETARLGFLGAAVGCALPVTDSGRAAPSPIEFTVENQVSFPGVLAAERFEVDAVSPLNIDWCSVTTGRNADVLDALAISWAGVMGVRFAQADALWRMGADAILQSDTTGWVSVSWDAAAAACTGTVDSWALMPPSCDGEETFLLYLTDDDGASTLAVLDPCTGGVDTEVILPPAPAVLNPEWCDPGDTPPILATAATPVLSWAGLTETADGAPLDPLSVGGVRFVRVNDSLADACSALASGGGTDAYAAAVAMTDRVPLDAARDDADSPFTGFAAGETWMLALLGEDSRAPPLTLASVVVE